MPTVKNDTYLTGVWDLNNMAVTLTEVWDLHNMAMALATTGNIKKVQKLAARWLRTTILL